MTTRRGKPGKLKKMRHRIKSLKGGETMGVMSIGFQPQLKKRITEAAKSEGITFSGFIRRAVIKYLESIGK